MELFIRLIGKPVELENTYTQTTDENIQCYCLAPSNNQCEVNRNALLIEKLDAYIKDTFAWRDPDISLNVLAAALCTNRTTLALALQKCGYENYNLYINKLRIMDFLEKIQTDSSLNFQEAFFDVGFRSRTTALRNFRLVLGMTPSEYFKNTTVLQSQNDLF